MAKNDNRSESPEEEADQFEVEKITDHKEVADKKGRLNVEFFVKWKNYPSEENTWEPRESLLAGAKSLLDAYIAKQERKGITVPEDGRRRKSMAVEKVKEDRPPTSTSSSKDSNKRKKKESLSRQEEDEEEHRPKKKKESTSRREEEEEEDRPKKKKEKPAPIDLSPEPEPVVTKKSKKSAEAATPEIKRSVKESGSKAKNGTHSAEDDIPVKAASSKKTKKVVKEPSPVDDDIIVQVEGPTGSALYMQEPSWDHLVRVESLEQDNDGAPGFRWYVGWGDNLAPEWISNEVARRKFPQRLFDFYEQHLKFRPSAGDADMEE